MGNKKEYAIGEKFEYLGITLETVEGGTCDDCHFHSLESCYESPICSRLVRSDNKAVHFVPAAMTIYDAYTQLIDRAEAVRNACSNDSDVEPRMSRIIEELVHVRRLLSPLMARMPWQGGAL